MHRLSWWLLGILLVVAFGFLWAAAVHDTAIFDETAHIPAGYAYVRYFDYRLNPEHPPLVKALAGLALLTFKPDLPTTIAAWQGVNEQWTMGNQFFYHAGNNADRIVRVARLGPIFLTLLLILVVYLWSKSLFGRWWAFLPAALVALSPIVLAHGHYVTTDIGAALGIILSLWSFTNALKAPSFGTIFVAGLAFGFAQLLKFSAILLGPFLIVLAGVFWLIHKRTFENFSKVVVSTFFVMLVGLLFVVYPAYALFTSGMPADRETPGMIAAPLLRGTPEPEGAAGIMTAMSVALAGSQITRPLAHWTIGLAMVFDRGAHGNTAYFLGDVSAKGSRAYFPLVYLLKEPLPILIILLSALLAWIFAAARGLASGKPLKRVREYIQEHFAIFTVVAFAGFYWMTSIQSPLNIGVRHLFPALPLMYIAATPFWKRWITTLGSLRGNLFERAGMALRGMFFSWLKISFLGALLLWLFMETVAASPYFLSYYNEIAGGTARGYRFATDSNYDWGQDLGDLRKWMDAHPEAGRVAVDYFGGGDLAYHLGNRAEGWWSSRGNPKDVGIPWLAVSVNTLEGALQPATEGFTRKPEDEYRWLVEAKGKEPGMGGLPTPDARAGKSILLYSL